MSSLVRWDKLMGLSVAQTLAFTQSFCSTISWSYGLRLWHWPLRSWIKGARFEFPLVEQGQVSLHLLLQKMCGRCSTALFKSWSPRSKQLDLAQQFDHIHLQINSLWKKKKQTETPNFALHCCGLPSSSYVGYYNYMHKYDLNRKQERKMSEINTIEIVISIRKKRDERHLENAILGEIREIAGAFGRVDVSHPKEFWATISPSSDLGLLRLWSWIKGWREIWISP